MIRRVEHAIRELDQIEEKVVEESEKYLELTFVRS